LNGTASHHEHVSETGPGPWNNTDAGSINGTGGGPRNETMGGRGQGAVADNSHRDFRAPGGGRGPRLNLPDDSAGFKVFLNSSDPDNFVHVQFGKVQEVEAGGEAVPGHGIAALGALKGAMEKGACSSSPSCYAHCRHLLADLCCQPCCCDGTIKKCPSPCQAVRATGLVLIQVQRFFCRLRLDCWHQRHVRAGHCPS
jgi:hypothetical protein